MQESTINMGNKQMNIHPHPRGSRLQMGFHNNSEDEWGYFLLLLLDPLDVCMHAGHMLVVEVIIFKTKLTIILKGLITHTHVCIGLSIN